jgi:hypothetical protein
MGNNKIRYLDHVFGEEDDIKKGNCYLVGTLLGDSLSINTLEFDVESDDSTLTQFKRNDPVIYEHNGKQIGIFYVQNIERIGATTYSFSAVSALGILAEGKHYGGIYTGQTVAEILPDICGTVPYEIKTNLTEIKLYGWLPIASPRDNLAQVLFAIGAVIKTDLGGVLRIESLWDGISGELTQNQMYEGPSIKYDSAVTQVVVTEHQYVEGGEETKLFEGTAQQGDIITFNSPMYELVADGFSILESGANYAKVSGGSGTLKGRAYIHNTREVVRDVSEAAEPNIKTVKDATLVSLVNSTAVAERLANYFQWTETIQAPIVYQGEVPGNRVATWHPYDKTGVTACLESADINLSNTLKADETLLVGFVPPKFEQVVTYDEHEVLTGSGTWTVPEGVTQVVVVLIGGGGAGGNGNDGTGDFYGGFGTDKYDTQTISIYTSDSAGQTKTGNASITATGSTTEAGTGGTGGSAGSPGKVYQKTIEVSAGETISYICGSGGQSNGASGEDTVFGEESSASGSAESAGYTDIVTGITYAKSGLPGSDGADGGTAGNNGGDAGEIAGGTGRPSYSNQKNGSDGGSYANYTSTYSVNASVSSSGSGGGGAGGPSGANNGTAGSSSTAPSFNLSVREPSGTGTFIPSKAGSGGKGADGASAALYGCGGDGGGGGGGGGAAGNYNLTVRNNASIKITSTPSSTRKINFSAHVKTYDNYSGSGGAGGAGGAGGDGCIILYYGAQKKIESGPVMDRTGRFILDKLGRRFVV